MENNLTKAKLYWGIKADPETIHSLPEVKDKKNVRIIPFDGMGNLLTNLGFMNDDTQVIVIAGIPANNLLALYDIIDAPHWKADGKMIPRPQIVVLLKKGELLYDAISKSLNFYALFEVVGPEQEKYKLEFTLSELIVLRSLVRRALLENDLCMAANLRQRDFGDIRKKQLTGVMNLLKQGWNISPTQSN